MFLRTLLPPLEEEDRVASDDEDEDTLRADEVDDFILIPQIVVGNVPQIRF